MSLESVVDYLGGFPIVVKRSGMSKGEGVFRVDDLAQLENMIDLFDIENYNYCFKSFTPIIHKADLLQSIKNSLLVL